MEGERWCASASHRPPHTSSRGVAARSNGRVRYQSVRTCFCQGSKKAPDHTHACDAPGVLPPHVSRHISPGHRAHGMRCPRLMQNKGVSYEALPCAHAADHLAPPLDDVRRCPRQRLPRLLSQGLYAHEITPPAVPTGAQGASGAQAVPAGTRHGHPELHMPPLQLRLCLDFFRAAGHLVQQR